MSADAATLEPFAGRTASAPHAVKPYLWSVRREVWENRTAVIAPAVAAAVVLVGFLLGLTGVSHWSVTNMNWNGHNTVDGGDPGRFLRLVPYFAIAVISMVTAFIAAAFYCLGALHNERKDRTVLFWKSLPVSDVIAVAAKATLPLVVIPLVVCVVVPIFQGVMLLASAILAAARPDSPAAALASYPLLSDMGVLVWGVFTQALWYAPVWGWLFLVSAWARRAPFLWAIGVPIGVSIVERMGVGSDVIGRFISQRLSGGFAQAFSSAPQSRSGPMSPVHIEAARFVTSADVWFGLVLGVALTAGAVWLRRTREPI